MPVVLLHSSLSSSSQWGALTRRLNPHFLCINIDLLGYGAAPCVADPEKYNLDTEAQRVIGIIDSQIGDRHFCVVGHSFGGAIGLRLAHLMGERLMSMVLYEPVVFHLLDKASEGYKEINKVSSLLIGKTPAQGAEIFVDYWNHPGFFKALPKKVQQSFSDKMGKVMLDFKGLMGETFTVADCALEHCPALVIEGKTSRLSAKTLVQQLSRELPVVEHLVFDGGHMAPMTQSEAVAELIADYLSHLRQ